MAGAAKLSIRSAVRVFGALAAVGMGYLISKVNLKNALLNTVTGPGSISRIIAILLVLTNLKNLPFVWHLRVLSAIFKHMEFNPKQLFPPGKGPSLLFKPIITTSHSPLAECDYNFHKSNSTYFSDLDVTRSNIVCCLLRDGIKRLELNPKSVVGPDGLPAKGKWGIMLGAVHCSFKKEIAPYETYEMWSRILCWDRKWIYVITHFVKKGAVKPKEYALNAPSASILGSLFARKTRAIKGTAKGSAPNGTATQNGIPTGPAVPHRAIFASAISKYVMKLGRLTIHPEVPLEASGLLPPRPGGWVTMSGAKPKENGEASPQTGGHDVAAGESVIANGSAGANGTDDSTAEEAWDWKRIEAENARGMQYAEHFAALDDLHAEFTGDDGPVLGFYRDVI